MCNRGFSFVTNKNKKRENKQKIDVFQKTFIL
jgi:hypothetical protein